WRRQTNRNNRAKQKMPHMGGSKSIATLMDEKDENGIEPTRAQVFILTHKSRKYGRPLDEESARTIDMINEKLSNSEGSNEQPPRSVAWEGYVYSQVLVPDANSGHERVQQSPQMLFKGQSLAENIPSSHGHTI
ncbi:hypothetical protein HAX54_002570, partial [Datura stramonium]|nr:hypothetical protein [Datura stramonium]